ncbi:hypothetical protein QBC34DRAFT_419887 [Podospora aff. communis PSN243]|uniref:Uncharacterized protein n=1 Tax=Podospora aff. communis PSN243 TaxID=3040156 RepID=A0AAV9H9A0_9PEZI|nr:hypothetical protein QBC34DRAFT_419887 [Podospora aff. communis PSN243]
MASGWGTSHGGGFGDGGRGNRREGYSGCGGFRGRGGRPSGPFSSDPREDEAVNDFFSGTQTETTRGNIIYYGDEPTPAPNPVLAAQVGTSQPTPTRTTTAVKNVAPSQHAASTATAKIAEVTPAASRPESVIPIRGAPLGVSILPIISHATSSSATKSAPGKSISAQQVENDPREARAKFLEAEGIRQRSQELEQLAQRKLERALEHEKCALEQKATGEIMKKEAAKMLVEVDQKMNEGRKERQLAEDEHRKAQDERRIAEQEHRLATEKLQSAQNDKLQAEKKCEEAKQYLLKAQDERRIAEQEHRLAKEERQLAEQRLGRAGEESRRTEHISQLGSHHFANQGDENYGFHEGNKFPGFPREHRQGGFRGSLRYLNAEEERALREFYLAKEPPPHGPVMYYQSENPGPKAPDGSQARNGSISPDAHQYPIPTGDCHDYFVAHSIWVEPMCDQSARRTMPTMSGEASTDAYQVKGAYSSRRLIGTQQIGLIHLH